MQKRAGTGNYQMREAESVSRLVVCVPHAVELPIHVSVVPHLESRQRKGTLRDFVLLEQSYQLWEVKHHYTLRFIAIFVFIIDFLDFLLELKLLVLSCTVGKISTFLDKIVFIGI